MTCRQRRWDPLPSVSRQLQLLAILDILVVAIFVMRGVDVRMVLFLGALPLFLAAGRPAFIAKARERDGQPCDGRARFARRWVLLMCSD